MEELAMTGSKRDRDGSVIEEEVDILKCEDDSVVDVEGDDDDEPSQAPAPSSGRPKRSTRTSPGVVMVKGAPRRVVKDEAKDPPPSPLRKRRSSSRDIAGEDKEPPSTVHEELRHVLSSAARRWCFYEFFKSSVHSAYLGQDDFTSCLREHGIADEDALTRVEWSYIRSLVGTPRRLSQKFLAEEREKLTSLHESNGFLVATSACARGATADDILATPTLLRGQRVTAHHTSTKTFHMGSVVRYIEDKRGYLVQFERSDLASEVVPAALVMPHKYILSAADQPEGTEPCDATMDTGRFGSTGALVEAVEHYLRRSAVHMTSIPHTATREEDVVVLRELVGLLERRELWNEEMKRLARVADKIISGGSEPNQRFQQAYAWLVSEIDTITSAIQPLLSHVRTMVGAEAKSNHSEGGHEHHTESRAPTSTLSKALVENSRRDAAAMVGITMHRLSRSGSEDRESSDGESQKENDPRPSMDNQAAHEVDSDAPPAKRRKTEREEGSDMMKACMEHVDAMAKKLGVSGSALELVRGLMSILVMTNQASDLFSLNEIARENVFDQCDLEAAYNEQLMNLNVKEKNREVLKAIVGNLQAHLLGTA